MIQKVYQRNLKDCGVACLISIIKYYKGDNTFLNIRYLTKCNDNGITALNLIEASKKLGFKAKGLKCELDDINNLVKPIICHVVLENGYNHYIVLYKITNKNVIVFDPYYGIKRYNKEYFLSIWDNVVIELIPIRKLDIIRENNNKIFKNIILKNKLSYILISTFSILSIILSLLTNLYFKVLIDGYNTIYILLFFLILLFIKESNDLIRNKILIRLENNVDKTLILETHNKLLSLPNYYFNSRTRGDIVTKFNDLEYIKQLLVRFPIFVIIDVILMLFTSIILILINKTLSITFFIICFAYFILLLLFNKKTNNSVRLNQESNSIKNTILIENINCIDTIKNMNIKEYRHSIFKDTFNTYLNNNIKYEKLYNTINFIKNIILLMGINIILFKGIELVNNDIILLSDLILFDSLLMYFVEPLKDIFELIPILKNGLNAIKRVSEIYDINISDNNIKTDNLNIKFNNLTFSYDGYKNVLNKFNYNINYKDKILVIGSSGSGKSTLFKLLNKSYEVDNNMIQIGNIDINNIDTNKYITYVSQEEKIFNDTIYNNIVLDNDKNNIDDILTITKLDKVLKNRNLNLNSVIEEEGSNLSKGEKQKIILSRALLKNNKILILDEALSGVDSDDELEIMNNILNKFGNNTIIYISHSKVCKNIFSKILNFDKGGNNGIIKRRIK